MLKNYLKIAWRKLLKHKVDAAISIGGLAVGIACCILLVAFVRYSWSYDEFHKNSDRVNLVYKQISHTSGNDSENQYLTHFRLAPAIKSSFSEVQQVVRWEARTLQAKINGTFNNQVFGLTEPGFFDVFNFPLVAGNSETALEKPNSILITREKALLLFGTEKALGKTITLRSKEKEQLFTVTGILADIPSNSSFVFDYLIPIDNGLLDKNWNLRQFETYVMLKKNTDRAFFEQKLENFKANYSSITFISSSEQKLRLLPFEDVFFGVHSSRIIKHTGNTIYSWILAGIALVILSIAALNFMSLSLSRATTRSDEIGLRKVVGASRGELARQFLGEAFLICLLAFILGLVLAELTLPWFSKMFGMPASLDLLDDLELWLMCVGLLGLTTLITGGYPAWVLSGKNMSAGFNSHTVSKKMPAFVKGLTVAQFALAITFLASAFIMYSQMDYISSRDLGFEPDGIVQISMNTQKWEEREDWHSAYAQEARKISGVQSITKTVRYGYYSSDIAAHSEGMPRMIHTIAIDEQFLPTMGIDLAAGRNFSSERPSEIRSGLIINEAAAEAWGWKDPLGKRFPKTEADSFDGRRVIGVVSDYHIKSLFHKIEPVAFVHRNSAKSLTASSMRVMRVEISGEMRSRVMSRLRELWETMNPGEPFYYSFLDDQIALQYRAQQGWKLVIAISATVAILLACFGLFGMAALTAERRTKEIGIRKVLGATVTQIVGLLSKDFMKLVFIGFVIAVPIAWYAMHRWLQDFAYRIEIGPGIFLLAGGMAVLIALATVGWQSIKAALANPVESLRSE